MEVGDLLFDPSTRDMEHVASNEYKTAEDMEHVPSDEYKTEKETYQQHLTYEDFKAVDEPNIHITHTHMHMHTRGWALPVVCFSAGSVTVVYTHIPAAYLKCVLSLECVPHVTVGMVDTKSLSRMTRRKRAGGSEAECQQNTLKRSCRWRDARPFQAIL